MKHSFKSILAILLCLIVCTALVFVGCDGDDTGNDGGASVAASAVTLNKSVLSLVEGESETLVATIEPADTTDKSLTWTSTAPSVASVNNGTVTAVGAGSATIIVTTANGKITMCQVTVTAAVTNIPVTSISLNKSTASVHFGDTLQLTATLTPADATDQAVTWESTNTAVATVENGLVTTHGIGTATITATTPNGKSASCAITVVNYYTINFELTANSSFYVVTGIEGRTTELEIPFLHDGLRVIAIEEGAFENNTDLTRVVLPNSIQHIYAKSFKGCSNLGDINLPDSLLSIGVSAFEECSSLTAVTVPHLVETISSRAFYHCTSLASLAITPETEEIERVIGPHAFYQCTNLETVTIGQGVETIGESAFAFCTALTSVSVGDGLETISNNAFDNCLSLRSFDMPNTVTYLGHMAFRHAEALRSVIFSNSLTAIGNACFQYCIKLDNVELHAGIEKIGESCFSYCSGMKNLRVLGDIEELGSSAFYECTALTNIYYASSVGGDLGVNNYVFYNAGTAGAGIVLTLSPEACIPERLFEPQENKNRPNLVKLVVESGATKINYFQKYNTMCVIGFFE